MEDKHNSMEINWASYALLCVLALTLYCIANKNNLRCLQVDLTGILFKFIYFHVFMLKTCIKHDLF